MSDIDKDIEILKSIQNCIRANMLDLESEELQNKDLRDIEAIENVLINLKTKEIENKDLKEKLYIQGNITEKWVKIAEKLAERLGEICIDTKPLVMGTIADEVHGCDKYISCKECFLDWARKEVEK